jgi:hypothetical protein
MGGVKEACLCSPTLVLNACIIPEVAIWAYLPSSVPTYHHFGIPHMLSSQVVLLTAS